MPTLSPPAGALNLEGTYPGGPQPVGLQAQALFAYLGNDWQLDPDWVPEGLVGIRRAGVSPEGAAIWQRRGVDALGQVSQLPSLERTT